MASRGRFQIIGDESRLGKTPISSPSADPRSGQFQIVGDKSRLGTSPVASPSANPRSGKFDLVGTGVHMPASAVKGLTGKMHVTLSNRAYAQSNNAAERGGRKKKK